MSLLLRFCLSLLILAFAALGPATSHAAGTRYDKAAFDRSSHPHPFHPSETRP